MKMRLVLGLTLLLLFGFAHSQVPTPSPGKDAQPKQDHSAQTQEKGQADKKGAKSPPVLANTSTSQKAEPSTYGDGKSGEQKPMWQWIVEISGILITAIATVFMAIYTGRLWYSTDKLWGETKRSVDLARDEFISANRPRMRIKHVWLSEPIEAGKPVMVNVVSVNSGNTEARILEFDVVIQAVPRTRHAPSKPFGARVPDIPKLILPSGRTLDHSPRAAGYVTLDEIRDIKTGHKLLYCFAYVDYLDIGEPPTPRKTSCCRVLSPSEGGPQSTIEGAFIKPHSESEYEYAD